LGRETQSFTGVEKSPDVFDRGFMVRVIWLYAPQPNIGVDKDAHYPRES
jgi:hypothetical protein